MSWAAFPRRSSPCLRPIWTRWWRTLGCNRINGDGVSRRAQNTTFTLRDVFVRAEKPCRRSRRGCGQKSYSENEPGYRLFLRDPDRAIEYAEEKDRRMENVPEKNERIRIRRGRSASCARCCKNWMPPSCG